MNTPPIQRRQGPTMDTPNFEGGSAPLSVLTPASLTSARLEDLLTTRKKLSHIASEIVETPFPGFGNALARIDEYIGLIDAELYRRMKTWKKLRKVK